VSDIEVVEIGQPPQVVLLSYETPDPMAGASIVSINGGAPPSNVVNLNQLADVSTDGETAGQVLTFDGTRWRPASLPAPPTPPAAASRYTQTTAARIIQITHGLAFNPAGVTVIDGTGVPTEYASISYPADGVVELGFDIAFTGTIYLS
jgi:hypothetical protein